MKWMAALGRFLLALGGAAFAFFLVAVILPPTTEGLRALREWWDTILFVFVVLVASGGTLILLDRGRSFDRGGHPEKR